MFWLGVTSKFALAGLRFCCGGGGGVTTLESRVHSTRSPPCCRLVKRGAPMWLTRSSMLRSPVLPRRRDGSGTQQVQRAPFKGERMSTGGRGGSPPATATVPMMLLPRIEQKRPTNHTEHPVIQTRYEGHQALYLEWYFLATIASTHSSRMRLPSLPNEVELHKPRLPIICSAHKSSMPGQRLDIGI